MERLDDQDSNHGALLEANFSLTTSMNKRPPLAAPTNHSMKRIRKRERCDEKAAEDASREQELEDIVEWSQ